jgi:arylsulfatase A-like enzyme
LLALLLALGVAPGATSALAQTAPCEQIATTCQSAGFVQGGAPAGNGLVIDCIRPIVQGTPARRKATLALPQISPQLVAACKTSNPSFGAAVQQPSPQAPANAVNIASLVQPSRLPPAERPNIVFVLTDDLALNLVPYMPHVQEMQTNGATFENYFVTDSLCCPSRSSIFTGKYPHDTGVYKNTGADGGYGAFVAHGNASQTFAVALQTAGYKTAMLGKYLNMYHPAVDGVQQGWSAWDVAGEAYREFNYILNQNGTTKNYGSDPADYLTDVLSGIADNFIRSTGRDPFFIEIATFAPHAPYIPAPRDADAMPGLTAPRTPAFNAAPDATAAKWLQAHPELTDADIAKIDGDFRKRAQSVLAVDAMIARLKATLVATGKDRNTYFVFSSDNGYHMGEHRLMPGKMTAYDTDIHVPLIVTGPGILPGSKIAEVAQNVDLAPTFIELAGMTPPSSIDGRSLAPLMHGATVADWRDVALVEHRGPHDDASDPDAPILRSGNPTTYEAIRSNTFVYVEYADGEREYHDRVADPNELTNAFTTLSDEAKAALHATLAAVQKCHDGKICQAAERSTFSVTRR